MTTERTPDTWTCRPSLFVSRMLGFALAMLTVLVAVSLFFRETQVLWLVAAVPVALWVGFKGGPLLLRALENAGLFGRVRLEDGRLMVGRAASVVRLGEPFEVDARLQSSRIEREYDLRDLGVTSTRARRTHVLRVTVFTVLLDQDGRRYQLVGDETSRAPGPAYETEGLAVRPLPVVNAAAAKVRLWGADLAQLLGRLREAPGYATPAVGEQPSALEDPRQAFCPTWKVAVGVVAILCAFVAGSLAAYEGFAERAAEASARMRAAAEEERRSQEALGRSLVGRRVSVEAQHGARMVGTVEAYELKQSTSYEPYHIEWRATVFLTVEDLLDAGGNPLPDDATVTYRFADDVVKRGDRIDERASDVEPVPAEAPDRP